jgi:hypothetical protein
LSAEGARFLLVPSLLRLERRLRKRLDAVRPAPRAELLRVLMLPDFERSAAIGELWSYPAARVLAELLSECEEDRAKRALVVGMLGERDRYGPWR